MSLWIEQDPFYISTADRQTVAEQGVIVVGMKQFSLCWILDEVEPQSGSVTVLYGIVPYVPVTFVSLVGGTLVRNWLAGCYFRLTEHHQAHSPCRFSMEECTLYARKERENAEKSLLFCEAL